MPQTSGKLRGTGPQPEEFTLTMAQIMFVFGRRPSDVRWLETADVQENLALVKYLARRLSHGRR